MKKWGRSFNQHGLNFVAFDICDHYSALTIINHTIIDHTYWQFQIIELEARALFKIIFFLVKSL